MKNKKQIRSTSKNSINRTSSSLCVLMSHAIKTDLYISSKQSKEIAGRQSKTIEQTENKENMRKWKKIA